MIAAPLHRRPTSLALRLFLFAAAVTVVMLAVVALVLSSLYQAAAQRAYDRRLDVYLKTLVAEVASTARGEIDPAVVTEPLFGFPESGWYWQLSRIEGRPVVIRASPSLGAFTLPPLAPAQAPANQAPGLRREANVPGPAGQRLRLLERELDLGPDGRFLVAVAADAGELRDELNAFNAAMLGTFAVLALGFLLIVILQVRYGLRPLHQISHALAQVRSGKADRLEGEYPEEVNLLVREVNALIDANREIVERARTHVANLAHALKTPLSVLLNEAGSREDPLATRVRDQALMMRNQVAHHLDRARMVARASVLGSVCEMTPIITSLARTMEKIHRTKDLAIDVKIVDDIRFRGERQDIEEMVGNLVDNACKWAVSRVEIEVFAAQTPDVTDKPFFHVVIDDDGPGLSPAKRAEVGQRGRRLDESKPGTGFGLAIVHELAALYGGRFELGAAPIGGLRTELVLPAA